VLRAVSLLVGQVRVGGCVGVRGAPLSRGMPGGGHAELIHCGAALSANLASHWYRSTILVIYWLSFVLSV